MRKFGTILALALVILPCAAYAQQAPVDELLTDFRTISAGWTPVLRYLALGTFGGLAVIDLVYIVGVRQTLSGHFDIGNFAAALVHEVLHLSFFFFLLTQYAILGPLIIRGFQFAAGQAGGLPMHPQGIMSSGIDIAKQIADQISILSPTAAIGTWLCAILVLGCFALIAIAMVYVIVESYFVVTAGQILMMFGGLRITNDIAVNLLRTCAAIGLKLMILQLIASVGTGVLSKWVIQINYADLHTILTEIAEVFVLAGVTISVPHMFERMLTHVGVGGAANVIGSAATIAAAGNKVATAAVGAIEKAAGRVAAGVSAGRLASAQMAAKTAAGTAPNSAAGRAAQMVASTVGNQVAAKTQDIARGLRGERGNFGSAPWRQAAAMDEQRKPAKGGRKP